MYKEKKILSCDDVRRILYRLTHQILEKTPDPATIALLGIQTRGVYLAQRIKGIIKEIEHIEPPLGVLDITLYRDDLTAIGPRVPIPQRVTMLWASCVAAVRSSSDWVVMSPKATSSAASPANSTVIWANNCWLV